MIQLLTLHGRQERCFNRVVPSDPAMQIIAAGQVQAIWQTAKCLARLLTLTKVMCSSYFVRMHLCSLGARPSSRSQTLEKSERVWFRDQHLCVRVCVCRKFCAYQIFEGQNFCGVASCKFQILQIKKPSQPRPLLAAIFSQRLYPGSWWVETKKAWYLLFAHTEHVFRQKWEGNV